MNAQKTLEYIREGAIAPVIISKLQDEIKSEDAKGGKSWAGRDKVIEALNQFKAGFMSGAALADVLKKTSGGSDKEK